MKFASRLSIALLTIFFTARLAQGQTTLGISQSTNQFTLYWSNTSNGTNCVLVSASSLASANWTAATDAVPVNYSSKIALAIAKSASTRFLRLSLVPPTSNGMALIPAGTFLMGDVADTNSSLDAAPTNVYVSAFYMDTNLVTYGLWETIYSYALSHGYSFTNSGAAKAYNQTMQPVQTVDWFDAVKWCNARSQQAGLPPVYFTDPAFTQLYTNGDSNVVVYANWQAKGYRLPTEAEWEKAARGGSVAYRFPWGATVSENQADYYSNNGIFDLFYDLGPTGWNSLGETGGSPFTTPVGSFGPNGYGLQDMAGNLEEWCWDWYDGVLTDPGSPYLGGANPHGAAAPSSGSGRVLRGGGYSDPASQLRCAARFSDMPYSANDFEGFRSVRIY